MSASYLCTWKYCVEKMFTKLNLCGSKCLNTYGGPLTAQLHDLAQTEGETYQTSLFLFSKG